MKAILKKTVLITSLVLFSAGWAVASEDLKPTCDGTPQYGKRVMESYRKLMLRTSVYEKVPETGQGLRLGIYQVQGACGKGPDQKICCGLKRP